MAFDLHCTDTANWVRWRTDSGPANNQTGLDFAVREQRDRNVLYLKIIQHVEDGGKTPHALNITLQYRICNYHSGGYVSSKQSVKHNHIYFHLCMSTCFDRKDHHHAFINTFLKIILHVITTVTHRGSHSVKHNLHRIFALFWKLCNDGQMMFWADRNM
jgi:hypothetical protein